MPIILTPGWYDINTSGDGKYCILKTLLTDKKSVHYIDKSGTYQYQNILFNISSICDGNLLIGKDTEHIKTIKQKNKYYIGLVHHEPIEKLDRFSLIKTFPNKFEAVDEFSDFCKACDYVMLGGCNKYKYIDYNIAYAGPLIQQDYDNNIDNHGVLEWNLITGKNKLIRVKNDYGYCTLNINDTTDKIPQKPHIILNLDTNSHKNIINHISKKYNIPDLKNKNVQSISFNLI